MRTLRPGRLRRDAGAILPLSSLDVSAKCGPLRRRSGESKRQRTYVVRAADQAIVGPNRSTHSSRGLQSSPWKSSTGRRGEGWHRLKRKRRGSKTSRPVATATATGCEGSSLPRAIPGRPRPNGSWSSCTESSRPTGPWPDRCADSHRKRHLVSRAERSGPSGDGGGQKARRARS